ncbi:MAG: galactose/glucose ABC transporter substrate-binding protein MglB [Clostridiaceae bacterium]|nr:galactose/glucose ABC transporter substrate-binding protein MglB [Clostridiaceae bacterium]
MKKSFLVFPIIAALLVGGCSPKTKTPDTSPTKTTSLPKIGVTIYKYDDNFMSFVRNSIQKAAAGKADVLMNDSQNDQAKQNDQVSTMISKGVKSLAINLVDPKAAQGIVDLAKAAKLPIVFFNKEPEAAVLKGYDKTWYVGTISSESGVLQGDMIAKLWKAHPEWDVNKDGTLSYVMIKGEPGHPDAEARTKYSVDTIVKAGIKVNKVVEDTAMWDTAKATDKMDAWISKYGTKIEVVITNNDGMALGAIASLEKAGYTGAKQIPVFGVDAIPDALSLIQSGKMAGTVLNDAVNQGKATLDLALNVANGKAPTEGTAWKLDENKAVRVPYLAITKDNVQVGLDAYK